MNLYCSTFSSFVSTKVRAKSRISSPTSMMSLPATNAAVSSFRSILSLKCCMLRRAPANWLARGAIKASKRSTVPRSRSRSPSTFVMLSRALSCFLRASISSAPASRRAASSFSTALLIAAVASPFASFFSSSPVYFSTSICTAAMWNALSNSARSRFSCRCRSSISLLSSREDSSVVRRLSSSFPSRCSFSSFSRSPLSS
mmetsp:Transcript_46475/g.145446  ORF Transcript_46475/g.145446 Transcript_46475/m.145446 type:complete len:201 (+) Transcript_46475:2234-2836(+)